MGLAALPPGGRGGYFSGMSGMRVLPVLLGLLGPLLAGCEERDRVLAPGAGGGPGGGDGEGPVTQITVPERPDTVVPAGPGVFVAGRVTDPDGVDSVFYELIGGITSIPPSRHTGGGAFNFAIPVTTNGLAGDTILVRVHGKDRLGNVGEPDERQIRIF